MIWGMKIEPFDKFSSYEEILRYIWAERKIRGLYIYNDQDITNSIYLTRYEIRIKIQIFNTKIEGWGSIIVLVDEILIRIGYCSL